MTSRDIRREANRKTVCLPDPIRAIIMAMTPEWRVVKTGLYGTNSDMSIQAILQHTTTNETKCYIWHGEQKVEWVLTHNSNIDTKHQLPSVWVKDPDDIDSNCRGDYGPEVTYGGDL